MKDCEPLIYWGGLTDSENRNSEKPGDFWAYLFSEMKFSEKGRNCTETVLETAQTRGEVPCILGLTYLAIRELV